MHLSLHLSLHLSYFFLGSSWFIHVNAFCEWHARWLFELFHLVSTPCKIALTLADAKARPKWDLAYQLFCLFLSACVQSQRWQHNRRAILGAMCAEWQGHFDPVGSGVAEGSDARVEGNWIKEATPSGPKSIHWHLRLQVLAAFGNRDLYAHISSPIFAFKNLERIKYDTTSSLIYLLSLFMSCFMWIPTKLCLSQQRQDWKITEITEIQSPLKVWALAGALAHKDHCTTRCYKHLVYLGVTGA